MFAIAFDLTVKDVRRLHPKGVAQAYAGVGLPLERFGFTWVQGSVYVCEREDLANLFAAWAGAESAAMVRRLRPRHPRL